MADVLRDAQADAPPTEAEAFLAGLLHDVPSSAVFFTPEGVLVQFLVPWSAVQDARVQPDGAPGADAPDQQAQGD